MNLVARTLPLLQGLPVFAVPAARIEFLHEPSAYLSRLQTLVKSARNRVSLSGLYLGTDELSRQLVQAAATRLDAPSPPTFAMLFDYGRGTRLENGSTSVQVALPLLARGATMSLWQAPRLRSPLARWLVPARFNELLGVQHMKVHVIDDVVVMSGANLSRTYFSDRQDRYVVVRDTALSNFCHTLLSTVARHSAAVGVAGLVRASPGTDLAGDLRLLWKRSASDAPAPTEFATDAAAADIVFVAPTVQMGPGDVRIDQDLTRRLLLALRSWNRVAIATGYFNLTDEYAAILREAGPATSLLVASAEASPWANSRGASRNVPAAYATLQAQFMEQQRDSARAPLMREWTRDRWSYHCKGVWALGGEGDLSSALTVIGSANMGHRSADYDLEAQFLMMSASAAFATAVRAELAHIERYCGEPVSAAHLRQRASQLPVFWRTVLPYIRQYM